MFEGWMDGLDSLGLGQVFRLVKGRDDWMLNG